MFVAQSGGTLLHTLEEQIVELVDPLAQLTLADPPQEPLVPDLVSNIV